MTTTTTVDAAEAEQLARAIRWIAEAWSSDIIPLTDLRAAIGGDRATQDAALRRISREPGWTLLPESNQKMLTREDRAAAVVVGDQEKHYLVVRR